MQRWTQRAAGGTSQRLKLGSATMRSRSRNPADRPFAMPCAIVHLHHSFAGKRAVYPFLFHDFGLIASISKTKLQEIGGVSRTLRKDHLFAQLRVRVRHMMVRARSDAAFC